MKKAKAGCLLIIIIMTAILGCAVSVCAKSKVTYIFEEAVEKNYIHYSFDNGVLTISGSGSGYKGGSAKEWKMTTGMGAVAKVVVL